MSNRNIEDGALTEAEIEDLFKTTPEEEQRREEQRLMNEANAELTVGRLLDKADHHTLEDKDKLLALINSAHPDFFNTNTFKKVESHHYQLDRIPERFSYDSDVMLALIRKVEIKPNHIDVELANNPDFVLKAIAHDSRYFELTEGIVKYNKKQFAIDAMKANPDVFRKLGQHRDVPEVVFEKIKAEPAYFSQIPPTLKADKVMMLKFAEHLQQNPIEPWNVCNIYRDMDHSLHCDRDVLKAMVAIEPFTIQYASTRLRNDHEIVELASRNVSDDDLPGFTRDLGKDIQAEIGNTDVRRYFKSKALYEQLSNQIKIEHQHTESMTITKTEPTNNSPRIRI